MTRDNTLIQADPFAVAASPDMVPAMISGGNRNGLSGNTEHLPMAYRPGSLDANKLPSRMGNYLHYRDGSVETI